MTSINVVEDNMSFEEAYRRLEGIATELEDGETPLEKSFSLYEEGQKLLKLCQNMLDNAEKKFKMLQISDTGIAVKENNLE